VAQAHFLRGTILGQAGRFKEAAAALERTIAINPRYGVARFKLALAYVRLNRSELAERQLQAVLDDEPDNFRAWHNMAAIAYTRGDLARAEELERRAVAIEPDYVEALNTLGAIAIVRKRSADAITTLSRASQLAPRNGQVLANLALAYEQAGRPADARQASERACQADRRYCGQ
jgi:tetratricopeptide (TPR) repeat protein